MKAKYLIGIDPGAKTGLVIYDRQDKKFTSLLTTDFWGAYHIVAAYPKESVEIYVENPNMIKRPMYRRLSHIKEENVRENMASKVGENRREAELLIKGLKGRGFTVKECKPTQTKMDAEQFRKYTGFKGATNQHVRDAGMLVFGY
jgi:hypothetical protein